MPVHPVTPLSLLLPHLVPSRGFGQTNFTAYRVFLFLYFIWFLPFVHCDSSVSSQGLSDAERSLGQFLCFCSFYLIICLILRNAKPGVWKEAFILHVGYSPLLSPLFSSLLCSAGGWPLWEPSLDSLALCLPVGSSRWEELTEDWKAGR